MIDSVQRESTLTLPSDREIVMQRLFNAPARVLFDVWTKPEHVRKWYGVRSTRVTVCDVDLRVGGAWRWVVTKPQGMEIAFSGVFLRSIHLAGCSEPNGSKPCQAPDVSSP